MTTGTKTSDLRTAFTGDCGASQVGSYYHKSWSGSDDPVTHKKNNSYDMTYQESRDGVITWEHPGSPGVWRNGTWISCFGGASCAPLAWDSNDDLSLVNKLGDKIRNHEFNAAVSVGAEGKEALEQIAHSASTMYRGMRQLVRGNLNGGAYIFGLHPRQVRALNGRSHKSLSNAVLATQLGWLPLMNDVKDAFGAVKALTEKPQSMTYHANRRIQSSCHALSGSGDEMGKHTISKRLTWTLSENFTIWESLSLSNPYDLLDAGWNATRLSFIADWFIPVGKYLSARSLAYTLKGSGYLSTFEETKVRGVSNPGVYTVKNADVYFSRNLHVTRVPLSSIDGLVALPKFRDFNTIPSWRRALTAVALATQMFL